MQYKVPEDWVIATGETHTVKEFLEKAFNFFCCTKFAYIEAIKKETLLAKPIPRIPNPRTIPRR